MFRETDTTQVVWERFKIQTHLNHPNLSEAYQCRLLKQYRKIQGEIEHLGCIYYAVCEQFFNAIDHLDYHPTNMLLPTLSPQNPLTTGDLEEELVLLAR